MKAPHFLKGHAISGGLSSRVLVFAAMILAAGTAPTHADEAEAEARRATRLYEAGELEAAAAAFERARQLRGEEGAPTSTLDYNLGTTFARRGEFENALDALDRAIERPDAEGPTDLLERATYNKGVSEYRRVDTMESEGAEAPLNLRYQGLKNALDSFRRTLELDPSNESARHNYALTKRRLAEIEAEMENQPPASPMSSNASQESNGDGSESEAGEGQQGSGGSQSEDGADPSGQHPEGEDASGSAQDGEAGATEQSGAPNPPPGATPGEEPRSGDGSASGEHDTSGGVERDSEASPRRQQGGLEATPTPAPTPSSTQGPEPAQGEAEAEGEETPAPSRMAGGNDEGPEGGEARGPTSGGASGNEPTAEQLDALRVLNSLEEGSPDQFKRLFQFRGAGGRKLERDW